MLGKFWFDGWVGQCSWLFQEGLAIPNYAKEVMCIDGILLWMIKKHCFCISQSIELSLVKFFFFFKISFHLFGWVFAFFLCHPSLDLLVDLHGALGWSWGSPHFVGNAIYGWERFGLKLFELWPIFYREIVIVRVTSVHCFIWAYLTFQRDKEMKIIEVRRESEREKRHVMPYVGCVVTAKVCPMLIFPCEV